MKACALLQNFHLFGYDHEGAGPNYEHLQCVWCQKITNMRCSIWQLRVTGRIASSSMANSPIHRQGWIHILQISCRWMKGWNTFLYAIGNFNMRCFKLINQTHHVVHRHMDLWGCRCMRVWIHMLYVAKIISLASIVTNELVAGWCITERVKRLAGNEIELGIEIPTIESRASNIPPDKGNNVCCHMRFNRSSWNM